MILLGNMPETKSIFESEAEAKRQWYTLSYEDAIFAGYEHYKKVEEKLKRTTIMMPQTIRIEIGLLRSKWDYSQRYLIYQLIYHGHSILEHLHIKDIREIESIRVSMGQPKIQRIRDFLYNMSTTVNGLDYPKQREVRVIPKIQASLGTISDALNIEQSSLMRLCAYYSFVSYPDLSFEILEIAQKEIAKFNRYVEETAVLYEGFIVAEENMAIKREQGI
jgi:hypothetical protein